jgi:hypothetical protein
MKKIISIITSLLILCSCSDDIEPSLCGDEGLSECLPEENNCNELCYLDRTIFVTENKYTGNMGGIGIADSICFRESEVLGNTDPTRYRAWLGTSESSPDIRFNKHFGNIKLPNGDLVAEGYEGLVSGSLEREIDITPSLNKVKGRVWSSVKSDGTYYRDYNCGDWQGGEDYGRTGDNNYKDECWTDCQGGYTPSCYEKIHIICVDQKGY